MKITRTLLTVFLIFVIALATVACNLLTTPHSEALETKIYAYLEEKYPNLEFEIKSYTQDTYTSGKYIFHVFCKTTEIDFQIYHSSFLTTDSYTVVYANHTVEKMILEFLGETPIATQIKSVQWLDLYADGNAGYKFREVDLSQLPDSVSDIENIYRMELLATDTDGVLQAIRDVTEKLTAANVPCDTVTFEWSENDYAIVFTTNMYTLTSASEEELHTFLTYVREAKQSDEIVTVSYVSRIKHATLFLDKLEDNAVIPGFNDQNSESETTAPVKPQPSPT